MQLNISGSNNIVANSLTINGNGLTDLQDLVVANNAATPTSKIDYSFTLLSIGKYLCTSITQTINFGVVGANGIDTGVIIGPVVYYIYAIYNPSTLTVAGLASLSSTNPIMPVGYTEKRLISTFVTSGAGALLLQRQYDREIWYEINDAGVNRVLAAGVATVFTSVSLASVVPPLVNRFKAQFQLLFVYNGMHTFYFYARPTGSTLVTGEIVVNGRGWVANVQAAYKNECWFVCNNSQVIDYKLDGAGFVSGGAYIDVTGYYLPI